MRRSNSSKRRSWPYKTALVLVVTMLASGQQDLAVGSVGATGSGSVSDVSVSVTPDVAGVPGAAYTVGFKASAAGRWWRVRAP